MSYDLKFNEAILDQSYRDITQKIQSVHLKDPAEAFVSNIDRVVALLKVPTMVHLI